MKKNISLIYRLCFIIFAVWGLFEYSGYTATPTLLLGFVPMVVFLSLTCITIVFIMSLKSVPKGAMLTVKSICTLLSVIVLIMNFEIIFNFFTKGWITGVLLPVMMVLDWLLFDKKGSFSPRDFLIWLGAVAGLLLLINYFFGNVPWLSDIVNFLRNPENLFKLITGLLGTALFMYLLDSVFGKGGSERFNSILLRLLFLVLEGYCYVQIAASSLGRFISSLKYYSLCINFLCFLCIAVLVIRSIFVKSSKNSELYTRIKNGLASGIAVLPLFFGMYGGQIFDGGIVCILLCIVCPLLMVIDCLLFDRKNSVKAYDPCLYVIVPLIHFVITYFVLRPFTGLSTYDHLPYPPFAMLGMGIASVIAIGYVLFLLNKTKKK